MFWGLVALLYYLCFLLFTSLMAFIAWRGRCHPSARPRLRRTFYWLALSLLLWQVTLFLEVRTSLPIAQQWLGRANFATVAWVVYCAFRFVHQVPNRKEPRASHWGFWFLWETVLMVAITLLTPLVSQQERVEAGRAITTFGFLFPIYLCHVIGYLVATVSFAIQARRQTDSFRTRTQLTLVGIGILTTGGVALLTNAVLPYIFADFRFCDIGTLSTLGFMIIVTYTTFVYDLFDLRMVLRETVVYGLLLAFVLGAYSSTVFLVTQYLTASADKLTQFVVLLIAFSFDPLRRFLEEKTDRWLFRREEPARGREHRHKGKSSRSQRLSYLALLFPWRRP